MVATTVCSTLPNVAHIWHVSAGRACDVARSRCNTNISAFQQLTRALDGVKAKSVSPFNLADQHEQS